MGRWKAWALAWLLAATLSALLLQAPAARGDELLVNGGFEDGLGTEWAITDGDGLDRADAPSLVHSGSYAGMLDCHGPDSCAIQQLVDDVGYGQEYELKAHVLWDHNEVLRLSIRLQWFDEHGSETALVDAEHPCTAPADEPYWCLTTGVYKAPDAARSAKVRVVVVPTDGVDSTVVYLDDFSFSGPPAPTPTPTPTPSPSPTPPTQTPPPTASPSPTARPSPSPRPTASPNPSPTAAPTATQMPTPKPSPPSPSPTASGQATTPLPVAGLVNGGFEEADSEGKPLGWRKWGGVLSRSSAARRDGQYAAAFTSRTTSTKWAFQTVAVEGGETYVLSGYALKNDANVVGAYLRLSWYASPDGSGTLIDSVDSTMLLTDDSPDFRFLSTGAVVAPAEAASAKVRLMLDPLSEAEGTVYFDDVSFGGAIMPPQPMETPQPSPPPLASSESPTASPVVPAAAAGELKPSSSPDALPPRPSPTVLSATPSSPEAAAFSQDGSSQSEEDTKGSPTQPPVVLYREKKIANSTQGGKAVAAGSDEGNGLSPIALVLAMTPATAAAAATAFFGWRQWKKRTRPP